MIEGNPGKDKVHTAEGEEEKPGGEIGKPGN